MAHHSQPPPSPRALGVNDSSISRRALARIRRRPLRTACARARARAARGLFGLRARRALGRRHGAPGARPATYPATLAPAPSMAPASPSLRPPAPLGEQRAREAGRGSERGGGRGCGRRGCIPRSATTPSAMRRARCAVAPHPASGRCTSHPRPYCCLSSTAVESAAAVRGAPRELQRRRAVMRAGCMRRFSPPQRCGEPSSQLLRSRDGCGGEGEAGGERGTIDTDERSP